MFSDAALTRWRRLAQLSALSPAAFLVACATTVPEHATKPAPRPAASTTVALPAAMDDPARFSAFVQNFRAEALKAGIRADVYDRSMQGLTPNAHILDLDNQQPEFVRPIWQYLDSAVSAKRIADGHKALAANVAMLDRLEQRYGVPKEILVAIWGVESDYGAAMGQYNMFQALATLGFEGRRTALGRTQLLAALKMEQREGYNPADMTSSWAGAFGQTQFMPTTFLDHAVDGDGDGRIDLWHSPADALASTAGMLQDAGWQAGAPWLQEVTLPPGFPYAEAEFSNIQPVSHWRALGVTTAMGRALPDAPDGAILLPAGVNGPAFLIYPNFRAILRYNNATSYALAVGQLALQLRDGAAIQHAWPRTELPLSRDDAFALQRALKALGYDPGVIDGLIGAHVKVALRAWQSANGLTPDGFPTQSQLQRLEQELAARGLTP